MDACTTSELAAPLAQAAPGDGAAKLDTKPGTPSIGIRLWRHLVHGLVLLSSSHYHAVCEGKWCGELDSGDQPKNEPPSTTTTKESL